MLCFADLASLFGKGRHVRIFRFLSTSILIILLAQLGLADVVMFDFSSQSGGNQTGLDLDAVAVGNSIVSVGGFNVTLSASANTGAFNYTAADPNFGINAAASGDFTDAFDAGSGTAEVATLSFAASLPATFTFVSIDFDRITGTGLAGEDQGNLNFTGGSSLDFDGSNVDGSDVLSVNESFVAGQMITLSHVAGNGFGVELITLEVDAIPEPSVLVLWCLGGVAIVAMAVRRAVGRL